MRSQHIRKTVKTEKNKDDALIFRFSLLEASSVQLRREKLCVFNRGGSLGSSSLWLLSSACKYVWCTTGISARAGLKCWVHMKCRLISTVTQCENTERGDGLRNTQRWRWPWIYPGRKNEWMCCVMWRFWWFPAQIFSGLLALTWFSLINWIFCFVFEWMCPVFIFKARLQELAAPETFKLHGSLKNEGSQIYQKVRRVRNLSQQNVKKSKFWCHDQYLLKLAC